MAGCLIETGAQALRDKFPSWRKRLERAGVNPVQYKSQITYALTMMHRLMQISPYAAGQQATLQQGSGSRSASGRGSTGGGHPSSVQHGTASPSPAEQPCAAPGPELPGSAGTHSVSIRIAKQPVAAHGEVCSLPC